MNKKLAVSSLVAVTALLALMLYARHEHRRAVAEAAYDAITRIQYAESLSDREARIREADVKIDEVSSDTDWETHSALFAFRLASDWGVNGYGDTPRDKVLAACRAEALGSIPGNSLPSTPLAGGQVVSKGDCKRLNDEFTQQLLRETSSSK